MKIALPVDNRDVNQHFGRSNEFAIIEIEGNEIKDSKTVSAAGLAHNHGGLAGLLKNEDVEVVIVGGIGPMAQRALEQFGMKVITGARGAIEDVAKMFAVGQLVSRPVACNHGHGHDCSDHSHGCGH